jgi:hypothetical protein
MTLKYEYAMVMEIRWRRNDSGPAWAAPDMSVTSKNKHQPALIEPP